VGTGDRSRAARFERSGEPADVLSVDDVRAPVPGPGEVLVAMQASVVQSADSMFIRGECRIRPAFPQVAGLEGTGIVVEGSATPTSNPHTSFPDGPTPPARLPAYRGAGGHRALYRR
jgi:NADPH:quinone reductase-like Zn-dependent oxidoreductase